MNQVSAPEKLSGLMSVIRREPERIMNSVPSVVMNDGMPKPSVIAPLINPTIAAVPNATPTATTSGAPAPQASTIM